MLVEIIGKRNEEKLITTSLKVSEVFGKDHKNVLRDIREIECSEEFNRLNFEPINYKDARGRIQDAYSMTRDGFTMLVMGYTGEKAMKFKEDYINAFNAMESELKRIYTERQQWQIERDKGVVIRHILTDTIKMRIADSPNKKFAYPSYTNLIYRTLFNKTAKELEQDYGIKPKENLRDFFSGAELEKVQSMEMLISSLIGCGWGYDQIKEFVKEQSAKMIAC